MVRYVDSVASQQVPPPYHFPRTTVNAFIWQPQMNKIKQYCDTYFNIGDLDSLGIVYEPLAVWPYAALLIIDYPIMVCGDPEQKSLSNTPYSERGYTSQKEMFVTFPVLRRGRTFKRLAVDTIVEWAIPFITVENPMSSICGREMLGLEKLCGEIVLKRSKAGLFDAKVSLPGWEYIVPGAKQKSLLFFEAKAEPIWTAPEDSSVWTLLRRPAARKGVAAVGAMRDFLDDSLMGLLPSVMQVVSLKQFRGAKNPGEAVYQALVSCRSTFSEITHFTVYNEKCTSLTFHNRGSFCQIIQSLFDAPENTSRLQGDDQLFKLNDVVGAFQFGARIDFDEMRTLHTFPVDRPVGPPPPDNWTAPWLMPLRGLIGTGS